MEIRRMLGGPMPRTWLAKAASGAALLLFAVAATGCATRLSDPKASRAAIEAEREAQRSMALKGLLDRQTKVFRVGTRVAVAGADLCRDDVTPKFGLFVVSAEALPEDYRSAAGRIGISEQVRVWSVVDGLPAQAAGVAPGDLLLAANGEPVSGMEDFSDAIEDAADTGHLALRLRAQGDDVQRDVTLAGVSACAYPISVSESDTVNAMADGSQVILTKGMLKFVETDDELALVIGHEIAHNALGHITENKALVGAGAVFGVLLDVAAAAGGVNTGGAFTRAGMQLGSAVNQTFSVDREQDADYMGIYLVERAGYSTSGAPDFWRRMAVDAPEKIEDHMVKTHPPTPERSASLVEAVAEIGQKKAAGLPLLPETE